MNQRRQVGALTEGRREQIKLSATFLNNIGVGLVTLGFVTVPLAMDGRLELFGLAPSFAQSLFCIICGLLAHLAARNLLTRLDPRQPGM